jgi:hypothetical protein
MKPLILAAAVLAVSALTAVAQTSTAPLSDPSTPAVATPTTTNPDAPVPGHNSFTETQAKERIEKAGYSSITALTLDDHGIWRSTATKDGKSVSVALDYQGNIVAM